MHADAVVATDLTFEGPWAKSAKTYIVHAIHDVMIPKAAAAGVKKLLVRSRGVNGFQAFQTPSLHCLLRCRRCEDRR